MTDPRPTHGYFASGIPYNRIGSGERVCVVFQGLLFENKPQPFMAGGMYGSLKDDFTVYICLRKPGLPQGCTLNDMADDYAAMIRQEFGGPVDVIGVSTGGSICQHFAADHPDLVRHLVIHSSAYTLAPHAKAMQLRVAEYAGQRRWQAAWREMLQPMMPREGLLKPLAQPLGWLLSLVAAGFMSPKDPNDLAVTVLAEDKFDFRDRLAEIRAPTLVAAGTADPFYTLALFRDTAAGIPGAKLILYEGMGHPASGKEFGRDLLAFLNDEVDAESPGC